MPRQLIDKAARTRIEAFLEEAQPRFPSTLGTRSNDELLYSGPPLDLFQGAIRLMRLEWGNDLARDKGLANIPHVCQYASDQDLGVFLLACSAHIKKIHELTHGKAIPYPPDDFQRYINAILDKTDFPARLQGPAIAPPGYTPKRKDIPVSNSEQVEEGSSPMPISILISHSSANEDVAKGLVDVLEASLEIPPNSIRCTSVPGYKLPSGAHTSIALRQEISGAKLVVGLLTPESISSGWVLFELGAAWGMEQWLVPIVADAVDMDDLPGPLIESNAIRLSDRHGLEQLIGEIEDRLNYRATNRPRSSAALDTFLNRIVGA